MTIHFLTNKTNCAVNLPIFLVNVILWTFLNKITQLVSSSTTDSILHSSLLISPQALLLLSSPPYPNFWTFSEREIHSCAYNHPWNYTPAFFSHNGRPHMWILHMKTTFMLEENVVTLAIRNTAHHTTHETNRLSQLASCYTLVLIESILKIMWERERERERRRRRRLLYLFVKLHFVK